MAKLIYTYGAMNASKSANLIMQHFNHTHNGKAVTVFKPKLDNRNGDVVYSRALNTTVPATIISEDDNGVMFTQVNKGLPRIVLVDEVQFFTEQQIEELSLIVDMLNVTVHCYGLLTDFRSELFAGSKRLVELADVVERVRSECTKCNGEGLMNARFINGEVVTYGAQVVTGAEETYKVLCRSCYFGMVN